MRLFHKILMGVGVLVLLVITTLLNSRGFDAPEYQPSQNQEEVRETITYLVVDIQGAVQHPGVYAFHSDARLYELIHLAGGYLKTAKQGDLNLAEKLIDGKQYRVPFQQTTPDDTDDAPDDKPSVISVNEATLEQLTTLPNIGPATAQHIIDFRNSEGPFLTLEDLLNVRGIGEATLEAIRDYITV